MKWCSVDKCPINNLPHKDRQSLPHYSFPRDQKYCQLWVIFCDRPKSFNPLTHSVCIYHFSPEHFERDLKSELLQLNARPKLKKTAIPTIKACDVNIMNSNQITQIKGQPSTLNCRNPDIQSIIPTMSLKKFSQEYDNRKLKREVHTLKQKILALERLNLAFREENKNLKRAVIEAEKTKQVLKTKQSRTAIHEDIEDVLVLPGYTVVLYK